MGVFLRGDAAAWFLIGHWRTSSLNNLGLTPNFITMDQAAEKLASYMSELSNEAWFAGWNSGLEYDLWRAVIKGPYRYGFIDLTAEHVARLRVLAEASGGWIVSGEEGEQFVSLKEWEEMFEWDFRRSEHSTSCSSEKIDPALTDEPMFWRKDS